MAGPDKSSSYGPYKYPIDVGQQHSSKISFQAIRIIPPEVTVRFNTSNTSDEGGIAQGLPTASAGARKMKTDEVTGEKCDLYLPVAFQVNDGFDYQSASLGALGAGVMAGLNQGQDIVSSALQGIKEGAQSVFDLFGTGTVSRVAAVRGSQAMPMIPDAVRNAIGIAARVSMNPNIRTMFNGVAVREFNFVFKFIPRSYEESVMVKNIIKFFRFHAYPVEIPYGKSISLAYDYPNMFKIRLLSKSGDEFFKNIGTPIKLSYLKTVSTTYNPTSSVLHTDGSPTEVDLTLTFTEYKPLSRYDVVNEDNDTFYHYENAPSEGTQRTQNRSAGTSPEEVSLP